MANLSSLSQGPPTTQSKQSKNSQSVENASPICPITTIGIGRRTSEGVAASQPHVGLSSPGATAMEKLGCKRQKRAAGVIRKLDSSLRVLTHVSSHFARIRNRWPECDDSMRCFCAAESGPRRIPTPMERPLRGIYRDYQLPKDLHRWIHCKS